MLSIHHPYLSHPFQESVYMKLIVIRDFLNGVIALAGNGLIRCFQNVGHPPPILISSTSCTVTNLK